MPTTSAVIRPISAGRDWHYFFGLSYRRCSGGTIEGTGNGGSLETDDEADSVSHLSTLTLSRCNQVLVTWRRRRSNNSGAAEQVPN